MTYFILISKVEYPRYFIRHELNPHYLRPVDCSSFQIGTDPKEARYWLRQFQQHESTPDQPFAVVQVDSAILNDKVMVGSI